MQSAPAPATASAAMSRVRPPVPADRHHGLSNSPPASSSSRSTASTAPASSSSSPHVAPLPPPPRLPASAHPHHNTHRNAPPYVMRPLSFHRQPSLEGSTTIYSPRRETSERTTQQPSAGSQQPISHHSRRNYLPPSSSSAIPFSKTSSASSQPSYAYHHPHNHHPHAQYQYPDHDAQQQQHHHHLPLSHATTARALGFALPTKAMLQQQQQHANSSHGHSSASTSGELLAPAWAMAGQQSHGSSMDLDNDSYAVERSDVDEDDDDSIDQSDSLSSDDVDPQQGGTAVGSSNRKRKRRVSPKVSHKTSPSKGKNHRLASSSSLTDADTSVSGLDSSATSRVKESKRTRVPQACDLCRRRKARCLNGRPIGAQNPNDPGAKCDRCTKQNAECVWSFFSDAGRQATAARKKAGLHNDLDEDDEGGAGRGAAGGSPGGLSTPNSSQDSLLRGLGGSQSPRSPKSKRKATNSAGKRRKLSTGSPLRKPRRQTLDMAARAAEVKNEGLFEQTADVESQGTQGISGALAGALDLHPDSQDPRMQPVIMELGLPSNAASSVIPTARQIVSDGMARSSSHTSSSDGRRDANASMSSAAAAGQRKLTRPGTAPASPPILPSQQWRNDVLAHLDPAVQRRLRRMRRRSESALRDLYASHGKDRATATDPVKTPAPPTQKIRRRGRRNTIGVPSSCDIGALTYVEGVYLAPTQTAPMDVADSDEEREDPMEICAALPDRPYVDWSAETKLDWLNAACPLLRGVDEDNDVRMEDAGGRKPIEHSTPTVMGLVDPASVLDDRRSAMPSRRLSRVVRLMECVYANSEASQTGHISSSSNSGKGILSGTTLAPSMASSQVSMGTTADRPPTDSQIGEIFDLADAGMASQQSLQSYSQQQQQQYLPASQTFATPQRQHGQSSQSSTLGANNLPLNLTQEYYSHQPHGQQGQSAGNRLGRVASFGRVLSFGQSQWGSGILGGPDGEFDPSGNGIGGGGGPSSQRAELHRQEQPLPESQLPQLAVTAVNVHDDEDARMNRLSQSDGED